MRSLQRTRWSRPKPKFMAEVLDFFNAYRVSAQHLVSFLLAGAIWRWGGGPERWLIGIFVGTMILPVYIGWGTGLGNVSAGPFYLSLFFFDLVAMVGFFGVALKANRNYPLLIAGFQVVALVAYLVKALISSVSPFAVAILVIGPSYCQLMVLLIGFVCHVLRQRRFGEYRAWRLTAPAGRVLQF